MKTVIAQLLTNKQARNAEEANQLVLSSASEVGMAWSGSPA